MTEDKKNVLVNSNKKQKKVFDCALYLTPPRYEEHNMCTPIKSCFDDKGRKIITNGSEITTTPSDLSNQHLRQSDIKYCISNDLMKKLDESSPLKALVFTDQVNCNLVDYQAREEASEMQEDCSIENQEKRWESPLINNSQSSRENMKFGCNKFLKLLNENGNYFNNNSDNENNYDSADGFSSNHVKSFTDDIFQPDENCLENKFPQKSFTVNQFTSLPSERKLNEDLKGGWLCPSCKNFNYEKRKKCNKCQKTPNKYQTSFSIYDIKASLLQEGGNELKVQIDENKDNLKNHNINSSVFLSNLTLSNTLNLNEEKDSPTFKKKKLYERVGDWICIKCKNLNFSFRVICNRCELPKIENDQIYEKYMNDMANYNKISDLFNKQNQYNKNYLNFINSQCFMANQQRTHVSYHPFQSCQQKYIPSPNNFIGFQNNSGMNSFQNQNFQNNFINFVNNKTNFSVNTLPKTCAMDDYYK
jgi:hypothetical protein